MCHGRAPQGPQEDGGLVIDEAVIRRQLRAWRRRSADVGGLLLATKNTGHGRNWLGTTDEDFQPGFAELLSFMYKETLNSVIENSLDSLPENLPIATRDRLIRSLDRWNFEPPTLIEAEVMQCAMLLFEALFRIEGMREAVPISNAQIASFIHHLNRIYRHQNTYHNFEHALDVLQATQSYLKSAGMVPPPTILLEPGRLWKSTRTFDSNPITCLGHRELFMLYVAAIGHDAGHPGFTNKFMQLVSSPLSFVFDHNSALEQMHCQLLLTVMRHNGFGVMLDHPDYGSHCRKILMQSVLATDMNIHGAFMERLKLTLEGELGTLCQRQTVVCQMILKNADISNPTRPFIVSRYWARALMKEWMAQVLLEETYALAPTVPATEDPIEEASLQIYFITNFVKPLSEQTVKAIPEMNMYLLHCKMNLTTWTNNRIELLAEAAEAALAEAAAAASVSSPSSSTPATPALSPQPPSSSALSTSSRSPSISSPHEPDRYSSAFPLTLPINHPKHPDDRLRGSIARSRSSDRESQHGSVSESDSAVSAVSPVMSDNSSHASLQDSDLTPKRKTWANSNAGLSRKQSTGHLAAPQTLRSSTSRGNLFGGLRPPSPVASSSRLETDSDVFSARQMSRSPSGQISRSTSNHSSGQISRSTSGYTSGQISRSTSTGGETGPGMPSVPHESIRAATKLGSIRKKKRDRETRNSWGAEKPLDVEVSDLFLRRPPSVSSTVAGYMTGSEDDRNLESESATDEGEGDNGGGHVAGPSAGHYASGAGQGGQPLTKRRVP